MYVVVVAVAAHSCASSPSCGSSSHAKMQNKTEMKPKLFLSLVHESDIKTHKIA